MRASHVDILAARVAEGARLRREYPRIRKATAESMAAVSYPMPGEPRITFGYSFGHGVTIQKDSTK